MKKKILKFEASWCNGCKILDKLLEDANLPYEINNINIDVAIDEVSKYNIRGIPTLILLDDSNNIIKTLSGSITKKDLLALV